ncbi:MAG: hypothetical protein WA175_11955 [Candidatus Acidiferrales bacterium]
MTTTFQKRQKEMKRMEKARMKAERRAQKKLAGPATDEPEIEVMVAPAEPVPDPQPQS